MRDGTEIRLYDPKRKPQDWTDLIGRTDCAVFLKNRMDSTSLAPDGRPFDDPSAAACIVFQTVQAAQEFCEAKVRDLPHIRCEIYDREGPAQRPLMVVVHHEFQKGEDIERTGLRYRKAAIVVVILLSLPLFWAGARGGNSGDIAIFVGINCLVVALRLLYWDAGWKANERKRLARLESHRKRERNDA